MDGKTLPKREGAAVSVKLNLEALLARLEAEELNKPEGQRRNVPSIPALAEAVGVHRATMYNFVTGKIKHVNLELLSLVMSELRDRGFEVELTDVFKAWPTELAEAQP